MTNEEYIKKWVDGTLTEDEEKVFIKSDDYAAVQKMLNATQAFKAPEYDVDAELKRFSASKSAKGKVVRVNWYKPLLQVAAVFLIMAVGYFFFFYNPEITIKTLAGEKTEQYLPDSSYVLLNAESQVSYQQNGWSDSRKVTLEGEAFFKVAKGSKFDVITSDGTVSVLGTKFNVRQRSEYFDAFCFEGLVQVASGDELIKLPASTGFRIINNITSRYENISEQSPRWIAGESYFESVPYSEVIQEVVRQYGINIGVNNVDMQQLFTGGFSHDDLTIAIKSITVPMNLSYEVVDDKHIILSGNQ